MNKFNFAALFFAAHAGFIYADQMCDCSKIISQCQASIKVRSVSGSKPSFTANYSITSTAAMCSKVSYYIDSTPYFNILSNGNHTEDSAFGTTPITNKNFSGVTCEVCASKQNQYGNSQGQSNKKEASPFGKFIGVWSGVLRWTLVSDPITIYINQNGNELGGKLVGKGGTSNFTSVTINGNKLTYMFIGKDGGNYSYTMELTSDSEAKITSNGMLSFNGTVVRTQQGN